MVLAQVQQYCAFTLNMNSSFEYVLMNPQVILQDSINNITNHDKCGKVTVRVDELFHTTQ